MEKHFYAQIDANNMVIGVSELSGIIEQENMISIDQYDDTLIFKLWNGDEFIENPNPPQQEPLPAPEENV